jgi:PAS domain S-box-containing protein
MSAIHYHVQGRATRTSPEIHLPGEAVPASATARPQPPQRPRILIVEDDARTGRVLELLLGGQWTVHVVQDARAALARVQEDVPDIMLTDLLLPGGLDGFGLLRHLREDPRTATLPVVVVSGLTDDADRLRALEAGANDFIIKPFSEKELLLRLNTHLEMAHLRREAALRESEVHLRSILDGALDAVITMDAEGQVSYWNPQAEATFGFTAEEALGQPLADLIVPEDQRQRHRDGMERFRQTGRGPILNRRIEVSGLRKDGSQFPLELSVTLVRGWGFYTFNSFCRDISEQKRAEAERSRLLEEAQEANRMKDEFLALLSHELRTPLSAIVGWAHMLRSGGLDEATRNRAIETIDRNAKLQNQLIEDILDVSRIVAGKFSLDMRTLDLCKVVESARDTVAPMAAAKGIELHQALECGAAHFVGDPDRLQQVVWNLVSNAIKFTPPGGQVWIELARQDSQFEIVVRDSGKGIEPEFLPHIFERFRQAESGTRRQGGLGLGLSIVKHIAEMHGGHVEVESPGSGGGATFKVRLPVVDEPPEAHRIRPIAADEEGLERAPRLDDVRVLIVDDEADARHLVAAVLQKRGALVFLAASSAEAMLLVQSERPDVILSDIFMPDEDGCAFIRKVRSLPTDGGGRTPAAALTAYARAEDRMRALAAGFQLHLAKPAVPAELVTVVATLAGKM